MHVADEFFPPVYTVHDLNKKYITVSGDKSPYRPNLVQCCLRMLYICTMITCPRSIFTARRQDKIPTVGRLVY
jgi:hypothetical protein